ncbi:hypothetical protein [Flavobacterium silvaticum]|uniref:Uncharacterized protein n=1 Tax=Flavobacterium silvaticum TaxID=1852020 RepID=A0A972FL49_9FLAO|nr:hypothetical protein [Flavobacterium silvaticum]NMH27991.1 hypothetical protein [Flavobacterium silvaticum]
MSGFIVTGKLDTVVAVKMLNSDLEHGKWKTQPGGTCVPGTSMIFEAENRDGSAVPPAGKMEYQAADGTIFKFTFEDNNVRDNLCTSEMKKLSGNWAVPAPEYPKTGMTWTVTYSIINGSSQLFLDAPVFPDQLIAASKCDAFPTDRVEKLIGDKSCIYLKEVFSSPELQPADKLWCATHPLFLTPASKALLTRDLVQIAREEFSAEAKLGADLDDALQVQKDFAAGLAGKEKMSTIRNILEEKRDASRNQKRDYELFDAVLSLTNTDHQAGWSNAVSSFVHDADSSLLLRRQIKIVDLISKRF